MIYAVIAAKENVLPLFMDMGGFYGINTSGEIISFSWDNLEVSRLETEPRICNIVLFQGAKIYPELEDILPGRPSDARICPHCKGTGVESFSSKYQIEHIVCYCGGLGWIPKEDAERGTPSAGDEDAWAQ